MRNDRTAGAGWADVSATAIRRRYWVFVAPSWARAHRSECRHCNNGTGQPGQLKETPRAATRWRPFSNRRFSDGVHGRASVKPSNPCKVCKRIRIGVVPVSGTHFYSGALIRMAYEVAVRARQGAQNNLSDETLVAIILAASTAECFIKDIVEEGRYWTQERL